jgi:cytochrome c biogenesis protein CcmG, thiol:disulfide interchange protein DsbE
MWRYAIPLVLLAVIAAFFYRGLSLNPSYVPSALIGKQMPEFSLPSLSDPNLAIGSRDLGGKVALLNVWGTWCVECRHEHGYLVQLKRQGVPIYGLNLKDDRATALSWLSSLGDPYVESAFDAEGTVAVDWGVTAAPETFLIGFDGKVLHKHISPLTPQVWRSDFLPLIREQCGADTTPCPVWAERGAE